jgi:hypothetical protein
MPKSPNQSLIPQVQREGVLETAASKLCRRLDVPQGAHWLIQWAWIGVRLASKEPEFKPKTRQRGRPKDGPIAPKDAKILDVIEAVMKEHPSDFRTVLRRVTQYSIEQGELPVAERTTHRKRLKRAWARRQSQRGDIPTLAGVLRGCWDK